MQGNIPGCGYGKLQAACGGYVSAIESRNAHHLTEGFCVPFDPLEVVEIHANGVVLGVRHIFQGAIHGFFLQLIPAVQGLLEQLDSLPGSMLMSASKQSM